jgi:hypothetical protein
VQSESIKAVKTVISLSAVIAIACIVLFYALIVLMDVDKLFRDVIKKPKFGDQPKAKSKPDDLKKAQKGNKKEKGKNKKNHKNKPIILESHVNYVN